MATSAGTYAPLDRKALLQAHALDVEALRTAIAPISADDHELLAYLRMTNFSIEQAHERLSATWAWREAIGIAEKMREVAWRDAELAMRRVLLYDFLGPDQHGRPVLVERIGAWDVDLILREAEDLDKFRVLHAMAVETLAVMQRPSGIEDPRGSVLIMDMDGLGFSHMSPTLVSVFQAVNEINDSFYPDSIAQVFVVNVPYTFSLLFTMVLPFLNSDTSAEVRWSSTVPEEIIEHLGVSCLPLELRGCRETCFPYHTDATPSEHPICPVI